MHRYPQFSLWIPRVLLSKIKYLNLTFPVGVPGSLNLKRDKLGVSGVLKAGVAVVVWLSRIFLFVGVDSGVISGFGSGREASRFKTCAVS